MPPLAQTLTDSTGRRSTLNNKTTTPLTHMDDLTADISCVESAGIGKTLVHVIDREGDSVAHMRAMSARGLYWLIQGKEGPRVEYKGETRKLSEVADSLCFRVSGQVDFKGEKAGIAVCEAEITIKRAAKPKRTDSETGRRVKVQPGQPVVVRLVVVRLSDNEGKALGRWTLLTNVSREIRSAEAAQRYYWRWHIESFFKLIKGSGHDVESWLQRSAEAILRRLLIASMACVLAWRRR